MEVLLVEDEALIRMVLAEDLADAGLEVTEAPSAETALSAVNPATEDDEPPFIVVTDVNLGAGMDGLGLVAELRQRWPEISVVVMTGYPKNLDNRQVDPREVWLLKPFSPSQVTAAVYELMHRAQYRSGLPNSKPEKGRHAPDAEGGWRRNRN